jgi:hypothetical protein
MTSTKQIYITNTENHNESRKSEFFEDVTYTDINNKYSRVKHGRKDVSVIMIKKTGYINVTNLFDGTEKNYLLWSKTKDAPELIELLSESINISANKIVTRVNTGSDELCGIYVHPELILHIAMWCNPIVEIYVRQIVCDYYANERVKNM